MRKFLELIHERILLSGGVSTFIQNDEKIVVEFDYNGFIGSFSWWDYSKSLNLEFLQEETGADVMMNQFFDLSKEQAEQKITDAFQILTSKA